ncbi:pseudouridine synthase [Aureimonas sp. AU40]|uniref:pseudouridine synthase n=1 Tax=Aureimonas sp. AU40 TaxID=1637747 RepID=UPI000ADDAFE1
MSDDTDGRSGGKGKGGSTRGGGGKGGPRGARPASGGAGEKRAPRGDKPFGAAAKGARGDRPVRAKPEGASGESRAPRARTEGAERSASRGDKPFRARTERPEGGERTFRPRTEGGESRAPRARPDGERGAPRGDKPFRARTERSEGGERTFRPRTEGGEGRPFRARTEGERGAPRGDKPFRPRAERSEGGERTFRPREGGKPGGRPKRDAGEGGEKSFVPRSRGMYSHGGARTTEDGQTEKPRSYGRLSHGATGERKPRAVQGEDRGGDRPRRSEDRPSRAASPRVVGAAGDDRMRIAKRLARAGIASRRDAEGMIADGRVTLNGKRLDSPAVDVKMTDQIEIDGRPLPAIERTRLWMFHKPAGLVTTNRDPEGRPTVFDRLPQDMPRVLTIGRLDINTEGLLLLTNDGGLARTLELPATGWMRRYRVRAHGDIDQAKLDDLRNGVAVDGVFYGAIEATLDRKQGSNVWLTLGLREGKNREVKRVLGHLGLDVNRLIRLSFGPFQLGELEEGAVQEINGRTLREQLGPTLIEESGADFDAPIVTPFSNKPVLAARRQQADTAPETEEKPQRAGREWISASDVTPNRKKFGAAKREDALSRMDTKAPRGPRTGRDGDGDRSPRPFRAREGNDRGGDRERKPFRPRSDEGGESGERPARRPSAPVAAKRSSNVWMAPGARAMGEKKKREREERLVERDAKPRTFRPRAEGGSDRPRGERPFGGERSGAGRPSGDRPGGDRPRTPRPAGGSRPGGSDRPRGPRPGGAGGRPPRGDRS